LAGDRGAKFAAELARALAECGPTERKFVFVGVLNKHLRRGRAVLVGGGAVELYTAGAYVTGDVDLIGDREDILSLLTAAGFERQDRLFVSEPLELAVDVVGSTLRPTETVEVNEVGGYRVPIVSVEDAIVDRLLAAEYWKSRTDWEQAKLLLGAHFDTVDRARLEERARRNDVERKLRDLFDALEATGRETPTG
jgi:hypothetical protein